MRIGECKQSGSCEIGERRKVRSDNVDVNIVNKVCLHSVVCE